jgi:hypothetical protein
MQRLVDEVKTLVVHFFEQEDVLVPRAIKKGLGFHENVPAISMPNRGILSKRFTDKGFRVCISRAAPGAGVLFWDTRGGAFGKNPAGKGFAVILSLSYFGTAGPGPANALRDGLYGPDCPILGHGEAGSGTSCFYLKNGVCYA